MERCRARILDGWLRDLRGRPTDSIPTPALVVDLDALERNIRRMADLARQTGVRLRAHAKTHKSVDIARIQIANGACGICCQKVSEAEAMVEGGIADVLISNQVVGAAKIAKLAQLAGRARIIVCVDAARNVEILSQGAVDAGTMIECLVEIDVGSARCGVAPGMDVLRLAETIADAPGLTFSGIQAYSGSAQHVRAFSERRDMIARAASLAAETISLLADRGLSCRIVGGAGTGTFRFEAMSGVFNELQCGSYVFMDADYQKALDENGQGLDEFENSLFVLTGVMSKARPGIAVCEASSVDSGVPKVHGRPDLAIARCSDEHAVIIDPADTLSVGNTLWLVPGHCDPTCNLYDNYVVVRDGKVENVWPVSARGLLF